MTLAQHPSSTTTYGFSPSSSPENNNQHLLYDESFFSHLDLPEDDLLDDDEDSKPSSFGPAPTQSKGSKKCNGRKGPSAAAADKRATHNAIERARRESLNGRFMTLAEALPSMVNVKRPSKSVIVNRALEYVYDSQVKEHALIKENNELRREVDQLRARLGMQPLPPPAPLLGHKKEADVLLPSTTVVVEEINPIQTSTLAISPSSSASIHSAASPTNSTSSTAATSPIPTSSLPPAPPKIEPQPQPQQPSPQVQAQAHLLAAQLLQAQAAAAAAGVYYPPHPHFHHQPHQGMYNPFQGLQQQQQQQQIHHHHQVPHQFYQQQQQEYSPTTPGGGAGGAPTSWFGDLGGTNNTANVPAVSLPMSVGGGFSFLP